MQSQALMIHRTLPGQRQLLAASLLAAGALLSAPAMAAGTPIGSTNISEADVLAAQQAWGKALVQIATDYDQGGIRRARATAEKVIDSAYGYQMGPVLFKPTLAAAPQTFRPTREGALAYFIGHNPSYPNDKGFALMGWRSFEITNSAIQLHGNTAMSMGNVTVIDKAGKRTTVDKTWGYVRDDQGNLRIVLHHSSLPFSN